MSCCGKPIVFEEYFGMGAPMSASPFLTPEARLWGHNLPMKAAVLGALLLALSFGLTYVDGFRPLASFLLVAVYFLTGVPALIESLEDLYDLEINIDVLMTLAAFSSVVIGSPFEGALLLVLFALSGGMEEAVEARAKGAISALHKITPTKAVVWNDDGRTLEKALPEVEVGTLLLIKAGEIVPLDGEIIKGASSINVGHITGENVPLSKKVGDSVVAGARNIEGRLIIRVTHTSADSTLSKIIELVTQAQESRPRLQRWFENLSNTYAKTIIGLAFLFALTLPFFLDIPFLGREGGVYRALAFLIAASPCALIIAIPIAYLSAVGACARKGILLKGGIILDALADCKAVAFDKTGTLTTGTLQCMGLQSNDPRLALGIACSLETNAVHPIAQAIVAYAEQQNISPLSISHFKQIPGSGLEATYQGKKVAIGNPSFILPLLSPTQQAEVSLHIETCRQSGELIALLLHNQEWSLFRFFDTPRQTVQHTISRLQHALHMRVLMLTGDHAESAHRVAEQMGITEFKADLKPADKLKIVEELSSTMGLVMVGDGINDAPALARATVGISMGQMGSQAAIDAADVVLLQDHIERLDWLMEKALATRAVVKQNLIIATLAILIASIPALAGFVPLWLAVLLHEGGTVIVGLNGLRLLR